MADTALSVNLNKVALVRNSRENDIPSVVRAAKICIAAGCQGITVHPRPDQRHVRPHDVEQLAEFLQDHPEIEYNIEGNPFAGAEPNGYPGWMELVEAARPHQATLVPDSPDQLTSDHGWDIERNLERLRPIVDRLKGWGARVSLFVDPSPAGFELAAELGVERVELYTGPYAEAFKLGEDPRFDEILASYTETGVAARAAGLELNAGHDLDRANLPALLQNVPGIAEVSIGHALIADALEMGYEATIKAYLDVIAGA